MVDPFTMLATIPEEAREDERVSMAIDEAMEGCAWYGGGEAPKVLKAPTPPYPAHPFVSAPLQSRASAHPS